jgi:hydrogenase-4 transcriptional activator
MTEKILIVEDEFIVANDLRLILEKAGYRVIGIAASVEEAIQIIQAEQPDVVLLDIHLKGKSTGIDLAYHLRERHIAFVYLSANSNQRVLEAAKATEPYGFLVKPFRTKDVLITLDIARYRHKHSLEAGLRQEAVLQDKLTAISVQATSSEQKMLTAVSTLQPFIPFDLIAICNTTAANPQDEWQGFLRIGFEEYQQIGVNELLTISGLARSEWSTCHKNASTQKGAVWYNADTFPKACKEDSVKQLIAQTFNMNALLELPISSRNTIACTLSFYSRKPDAWHAGHLGLLERLQHPLAAIINRKTPDETTDPVAKQPVQEPVGQKEVKVKSGFEGVIGSSHQLLSVLDYIAQVAPFETSVLILGESGTGKERIAHCLHYNSPRKNKPFIKINCAALPPALIESELFGHEKGAFTGATDKRIGKFEQAHEGTIFLDEIGEMPAELQVKLLRVLQEKEIERIGGKAPFKINVRVVAATNRQLEKEVAEGRFRLDLYYRLNVFPVMLPPLRERKEDIPQLAYHFATMAAQRNNKPFQGIAPKMMAELEAWHWPGNIRELENVIEQSVILNDGNTPIELKRPLAGNPLSEAVTAQQQPGVAAARSLTDVRKIQDETEREYIITILRKTNGRIRGEGGAAQLLNLKPTTLESKMLKLGIKKDNL